MCKEFRNSSNAAGFANVVMLVLNFKKVPGRYVINVGFNGNGWNLVSKVVLADNIIVSDDLSCFDVGKVLEEDVSSFRL